jgi:hypothetical protein
MKLIVEVNGSITFADLVLFGAYKKLLKFISAKLTPCKVVCKLTVKLIIKWVEILKCLL